MFAPFFCVLMALAGPGNDDSPVEIEMEISPETIQLGDVLFVKITVTNVGDEPVPLPGTYDRVLGTLRYDLTHYRSRYSFEWSGELGHGSGSGGMQPLRPRESRVVVWDALQVPPVRHIRRDFWSELSQMDRKPFLRAVMCEKPMRKLDALVQGPELKPRADDEVERLLNAYGETSPERMVFGTRPVPADFGLWSFPSHVATPEKLAALEVKLSEGTLRHIVRMTRLMQLIAITEDEDAVHSKNDVERRARCKELLALLDSCHDLEREWLGQKVLEWFYARTIQPDLIEQALVEAVIKRLPETLVDEVRGHISGRKP